MALQLTRFDDVPAFYEHVALYLLQHEAEHNIILGLRQNILRGAYAAPVYMSCVEDGATIVAVALRTPPHQLHLSRIMDKAALPLIAHDIHGLFESLPRVGGDPATTKSIAESWSKLSGQSFKLDMAQGIYQLTTVKPPHDIPGEMRIATENDIETVINWMIAFESEALDNGLARAEVERITRLRIPSQPERGFRLWVDNGKIVSMAGYTGPTPNGIRVNAVYTPPQLRGHGYATACVAALSQELLDSGRQFCFLFTDMGNPTSNKIYQNIGYESVSEIHVYTFE